VRMTDLEAQRRRQTSKARRAKPKRRTRNPSALSRLHWWSSKKRKHGTEMQYSFMAGTAGVAALVTGSRARGDQLIGAANV
jgi:hypothetical protein